MGEASGAIRRQVLFSGTVQGVFFRANTVEVSRRFEVTGFVRNLRDGRVELVAEGKPDVLDAFVKAVSVKMAGYIRHTESADSPAIGEFHDFQVAY
jgi:acylphosphatase